MLSTANQMQRGNVQKTDSANQTFTQNESFSYVKILQPNALLLTAQLQIKQQHGNCLFSTFNKKVKKKVKAFLYLIPSVGPGGDPSVQAVSPQVTVSHPPGCRLPLLSARPAVTSPAAEHDRTLAGTKLYCLPAEAHRCEQLAQGRYAALPRVSWSLTSLFSTNMAISETSCLE